MLSRSPAWVSAAPLCQSALPHLRTTHNVICRPRRLRVVSTPVARPLRRAAVRASSASDTGTHHPRNLFARGVDITTRLFPVWVALGAVVAALYPPSFLWFKPGYIVGTLAGIMAGMGLTLAVEDFALVLSRPRVVLLGVAAQYGVMPFLGVFLSRVLGLSPELAVGCILVSVCPGGAASNIVCMLGKADVALSVVLTLCSTLLSIIMIPTLMKVLAGSIVDIHPLGLLLSTSQVVLLPLLAGFLLKKVAPGLVKRITGVLPLASVAGVTFICGSVVARTNFGGVGGPVVLAMSLLHAFGGLFGFIIAKLSGLSKKSCRTISIEVMMQNSSLAVALALAHFASPLTAVPGAISATMHSVMGSILAGSWRALDSGQEE